MKNHTNELNCFLLGVGAALDYISGAIKSPPQIITRMGFEWLFRLLTEPKRLFKRYFFIVPTFIYLMIKEKIIKKV
jgi:N-acetylglucosaminyldiphosphoundecaprenol N-acetyl-beta-D-mannosaminyltransferase